MCHLLPLSAPHPSHQQRETYFSRPLGTTAPQHPSAGKAAIGWQINYERFSSGGVT